jgi:hypothetical protein
MASISAERSLPALAAACRFFFEGEALAGHGYSRLDRAHLLRREGRELILKIQILRVRATFVQEEQWT